MIRVSYTAIQDPDRDQVSELREYASVAGHDRDQMLLRLLKQAMTEVQQYADRSILPCTVIVESSVCEDGTVRLYQTVDSIDEVYADGELTGDWKLVGNLLTTPAANAVKVVYRTAVREADLAELLPVAVEYASAKFFGLPVQECDRILKQC